MVRIERFLQFTFFQKWQVFSFTKIIFQMHSLFKNSMGDHKIWWKKGNISLPKCGHFNSSHLTATLVHREIMRLIVFLTFSLLRLTFVSAYFGQQQHLDLPTTSNFSTQKYTFFVSSNSKLLSDDFSACFNPTFTILSKSIFMQK